MFVCLCLLHVQTRSCRDGQCCRIAKDCGSALPFPIFAVSFLHAGIALDREPLGRRAAHFRVVMGWWHGLVDFDLLLDLVPRHAFVTLELPLIDGGQKRQG